MTPFTKLFAIAAAIAELVCVSTPARAAPARLTLTPGERVIDLPIGEGLRQRVLYDAPAHPRATLVMLPGGSGDIGVHGDGDLSHADNFMVRTRADWVARGYAVLIPDTVERANLRGLRSSPAYAQLVDQLATYARSQAAAPVFLLGTSQGAIAAMNGAAHAPRGLLAGVVLTESVSLPGRSTETVFDADPQNVRVPALVVANRDDACDVAPPSMAPQIAAAMNHASEVRTVYVRGGTIQSDRACGSLTPHGYYGVEGAVISAINDWLCAHGG